MDKDPLIENEADLGKRIEELNDYDKGIEMLERPQNNDFVTGLKSFIAWIQNLLGKQD